MTVDKSKVTSGQRKQKQTAIKTVKQCTVLEINKITGLQIVNIFFVTILLYFSRNVVYIYL